MKKSRKVCMNPEQACIYFAAGVAALAVKYPYCEFHII